MSVPLIKESSVRKYVVAITLFIVAVSLSLAIFFISLFANVDRAVESEIWGAMASQRNHIDTAFSTRFQHLESAADFLGKQADIHGEIARQYIRSLSENSSMQRVAIFDTDGNAVFDNGDTFEGVDVAYVRRALQGERSVSDVSESLVDGVGRFFLSVPIWRGDQVVGVLSGSFNIEELGGLLFADRYEGQSVLFITDLVGQMIYAGAASNAPGLEIPQDLHEHLREVNLLNGETVEKLIAKVGRRETGTAQYRQRDGYAVFLLYTPLADSELMLMHAIPRDVAYGEFSFIEASVIILSAVLLICVVLLVIFLLSSSTHSRRNLVHYAQTDPLTGLSNKQYTQEAVDHWLKSDACTGIQAMLFMDIDYFKQINDTFGHSVGDDALRFVGETLRQEFRSSDIIGRVGGDEFVVFMRNVPIKQVVRTHAASLNLRMMGAQIPGLDRGMLHCSIGIAYAPDHGSTYHDLSICADKALYQTKEKGREGFTEYMLRQSIQDDGN